MTNRDIQILEKIVGSDKVILLSKDENAYIGLVRFERAINLIVPEVAEIALMRETKRLVKSPSTEFELPLAIRIDRDPRDERVEFDPSDYAPKRLILERDDYRCQYCGFFGDTIDHIFPKSLGGPNTWENLATACKKCNEYKSDFLLEEIGWERPNTSKPFAVRSMRNTAAIVKSLNNLLEV